MTNSVPAGLSSQLQCYPYNTDEAVTADHNTCEQELMKDKAILRPAGKCRMSIRGPQKQEQVPHKAHSSWNVRGSATAGKHEQWINHSTTPGNPKVTEEGEDHQRLYTALYHNQTTHFKVSD